MIELTINIQGMSCQHCVMRIKKAIDSLAGVSKSEVKVGSATVSFDESKIKQEDIAAAIAEAGYKVSS